MNKIIVILGDDNNSQYRQEVELIVNINMYCNLKEIGDEYDKYWDKLCEMIRYEVETLPYNWFINGIEFC